MQSECCQLLFSKEILHLLQRIDEDVNMHRTGQDCGNDYKRVECICTHLLEDSAIHNFFLYSEFDVKTERVRLGPNPDSV